MDLQYKPIMVNVPLVVTLTAYTQYDSVGGLLATAQIPQITGGGYINWGRLVDGALQSEPFELLCFYALPSTIADAAEYIPLEADEKKWFTTLDIPAANYKVLGAEAYAAFFHGKDKITNEYHFFPYLATGVLNFYLRALLTPDYAAAADLTLDLCIMVG